MGSDGVSEDVLPPCPPMNRRFLKLGSNVLGAFVDWTWIHRKVESVDLMPDEAARRRVSIDCTPPEIGWQGLSVSDISEAGDEQTLVPLALMAKAPLQGLDVRDSAGASIPVLGREANAVLAASAIAFLVWLAVGKNTKRLNRDFKERILRVAAGSPHAASNEAELLVKELRMNDFDASVLRQLAATFLLVAVMPEDAHERRVVLKYAYHWEVDARQGRSRVRDLLTTFAVGFGFARLKLDVEINALFTSHSYHFECSVPEGLVAADVELPATSTSVPSKQLHSRVLHARGRYSREQPDGSAWLGFWIDRRGLLPRVLWSAAGVAALYAGILFVPEAAEELTSSVDAATTLLLFLPALLVALNARRPENRVVARALVPLRLAAIVMSVLLFVVGAALVFGLDIGWVLGLSWAGLASAGTIALLCVAGEITLGVRSAR